LLIANFLFDVVWSDLLTNYITFSFDGPIGGFILNTNLPDTWFSTTGITLTLNVD
jgi:hypothetical protein